MEDTRIEGVDDADLEQVSGGHGIGILFGKGGCDGHGHGHGHGKEIVGKVLGIAGHVLEGVGHLLGKLGHHNHH
jgi:hypothetical protein